MIIKHLGVALFGFECSQLDHEFYENKMLFVFVMPFKFPPVRATHKHLVTL